MCDCFLMICLLWILLCGLHCKVFVLWLVVCLGMAGVSRETCVGMCVVLKNEGMVFDHVTSPLPVVVGVGVFSCLMFHAKLFH